VLGWIDCSAYVPEEYREWQSNPLIAEYVLNGIAYDKESRTLYITGKKWPMMYAIRVDWK